MLGNFWIIGCSLKSKTKTAFHQPKGCTNFRQTIDILSNKECILQNVNSE